MVRWVICCKTTGVAMLSPVARWLQRCQITPKTWLASGKAQFHVAQQLGFVRLLYYRNFSFYVSAACRVTQHPCLGDGDGAAEDGTWPLPASPFA